MASFDELVAEATQKGSNKLHALVMLAVDSNGKEFYEKTSGRTALADDAKPVERSDAFHIASCSKLITTIAVLQNVERGVIALDEPVNKWLPEFDDIEVLGTDPEKVQLSKANSKVTLRQLLTHTSGIGYDVFQLQLVAWRKSRGEEGMHSRFPIEVANRTPLLFQPGEGWEYGAGLDWAGLLVARANNTTFEDYLQRNIFAPLGMKDTTFHLKNRPHLREKLVHVLTRGEDGNLLDIGTHIFPDPAPAESGGHGLISTPDDFLKILNDAVSKSPRLLKEDTLKLMFEPQLKEGSAAWKALQTSPLLSQLQAFAPEGAKRNFGLGAFLVLEDLSIGKTKNTLSWTGMANWLWFVNRDLGAAGLFVTHTLPYAEPESMKLEAAFQEEIFKRLA